MEGRAVQIADVKADPEYTFSPGLDWGTSARRSGFQCCGKVCRLGF